MHRLIHCNACRQPMRLPESYVGKRIQCPQCNSRFTAQPEPEVVADVDLVEETTSEPAPTAAGITAPVLADPEPLWVKPVEIPETREAGPLRLRKKPKKPTPKAGRRPFYLFLLGVLPLGLPVLALAFPTNGSREPFLIPFYLGWLGVVLTSFGLVMAFASQTSVGIRLAASLTLTILAYAATGLILLVTGGGSETSPRDWRLASSPEDHYSVLMPGFANQYPRVGPLIEGRPMPGRRQQVDAVAIQTVFSVDAYPTPANFRPEQFLDNCRKEVDRSYPFATVLQNRRVFASGLAGWEFTLRQPANVNVVIRYFANLQRVYVLTITSTGRPVSPSTRDRFFNSFVVQPAPLPWNNPPPPEKPPEPKPPTPEPAVPGLSFQAGGEVRALAFAPDGRTLAVAAEEQGVTLWDANTGGLRARAETTVNVVTAMSYSSDGRTLAVGGGDGPVVLFDAVTGAKQRTYEPWAGQPVAGFAFSPDGKWLAAASGSSEKPVVRIWDLATGEGRDLLPQEPVPPGAIRYQAVAFTPESARLFVAAYELQPGKPPERVDRFFDAQSGEPASQPLIAYRSERRLKTRLSPDSRQAAYFTNDGAVRLWDTAANRETATLGGHRGTVSEIVFSADSSLLASVSTDGVVKLWDLRVHRERASFSIRSGESSTLGKLAFSNDSRTLATALGRKVSLWDVDQLAGKHE